jgi:hypothetical protein
MEYEVVKIATYDGQDMGHILFERHTLVCEKFSLPYPDAEQGSDSAKTDETYLGTFYKPTRRISINAVKYGTIAQIRSFISTVETRAGTDGEGSTYTFASDTTNSPYEVLVEDFEWEYEGGKVSVLTYSLKLMEGTML